MPQANVRFFEHPVERTEEQIEELRLAGLLRGEPSALDMLPPRGAHAAAASAAPVAAGSAAGTPDPPAAPAPGSDKPPKSKE